MNDEHIITYWVHLFLSDWDDGLTVASFWPLIKNQNHMGLYNIDDGNNNTLVPPNEYDCFSGYKK